MAISTQYHSFSAAALTRPAFLPREQVNPNDVPEFDPLDYILKEPLDQKPDEIEDVQNIKVKGVRFMVEGNLIHFSQDKLMKTIQDVYMKVIQNELYFSVDGSKWLPFGEVFSLDCNLNFPIEEGSDSTEITVNFEVNSLI